MGRWPNKYVIGLTGNIAVGKSVVRQMLQHLGAYTIDADALSHQATAPGAPAYAPTVEMFGRFILDAEGKINRQLLGGIVFTYPDALQKLEAIVHPAVNQAINTLVSRAKQPIVVVEAIKLLEGNLADMMDAIWVVDAPPDTQLRRLVEKRGLPPDEARKRIIAQRPQAEKLRRATRIITNDGNVDETWRQVQAGWNDVRRALAPAPERAIPTAPLPTPQPAPPRPVAPPPAEPARPIEIQVRRGMPGNAEQIAHFISRVGARPISRMDIMLAFGQKSYLLVQDRQDRILALIGWQVENLITRADEFFIEPNVPREAVINALVQAIEAASKELQSEVGFILLSDSTPQETIQSFMRNGYETTTLDQIRIPAWREAVHEIVGSHQRILTRKLRADRVMKPI